MRKRDTVRNINNLTQALDSKCLISYYHAKSGISAPSIKIISYDKIMEEARIIYYDWNMTRIPHVYTQRGVRSIDQENHISITTRMIKYLWQIGVATRNDSGEVSLNYEKYVYWCNRYNLKIAEKVKQLLSLT